MGAEPIVIVGLSGIEQSMLQTPPNYGTANILATFIRQPNALSQLADDTLFPGFTKESLALFVGNLSILHETITAGAPPPFVINQAQVLLAEAEAAQA